jgi:hypothetical protein
MPLLEDKKRIISLIVLFFTLYPILPLRAATEGDKVTKRYRNSVVYITTEPRHSKGNGFGFVVGENKIGNKLYVVTAAHVVKEYADPPDSEDSKISVTFCEARHEKEAKLLNYNKYLDIALLEVPKPRGYQWKRGYYCSNYERGDDVWLIGINPWIVGKSICDIPPDNQAGEIFTENSAGFLEVSIPQWGTSGTPLIHENGIIGMFRKHKPFSSIGTVLPIRIIQTYVSESHVTWGLWECSHLPSSHSLGMAWKLYSDPREYLVREKEEIVFGLTPNTKEPFTLYFGDNSAPVFVSTSEISCLLNGECEPVFRSHVYKTSGTYKPYVIYDNGNKLFLENAQKGLSIVSLNAHTDEQLKKRILEQMLQKLVSELRMVQNRGGLRFDKLVVGVLKDANFEYPKSNEKEEKEAELNRMAVKCVTSKLVENGYKVVERHPEALTRLAYNSLVKTERNAETGKFVDKPVDHLEYYLLTEKEGYEKPFFYDIKIGGSENQYKEQLDQITDDQLNQKSKVNLEGKPANVTKQEGNTSNITITHERPRIFAKIDTANHLLFIKRTQPLMINTRPYFSEKYQLLTAKRTVSVKMHVRLLKQGGEIVWMKDIEVVKSDMNQTIIPPKFMSSHISQENEAFCGMLE